MRDSTSLLTEAKALLGTYRNGESQTMADRIGNFLIHGHTPKDPIPGLALSLVQDLGAVMENSRGLDGFREPPGEWTAWSYLTQSGGELHSYIRLRDALDGAPLPPSSDLIADRALEFVRDVLTTADGTEGLPCERDAANMIGWGSFGALRDALNPPLTDKDKAIFDGPANDTPPGDPTQAFVVWGEDLDTDAPKWTTEPVDWDEVAALAPEQPTLTLVVNGTEYRTQSTSVRGKLGGVPIRAEWSGKEDIRIHVDTPGYVPPPAPNPLGGERHHAARVDARGGNLKAVDPVKFGEAVAETGLTGKRGDRILIDDPDPTAGLLAAAEWLDAQGFAAAASALTRRHRALLTEVEPSSPAAVVRTINAAIDAGLIDGRPLREPRRG